MTPSDIARETDFQRLAARYYGYVADATRAKDDREVDRLEAYLKEEIPALILSAAAKMVQQTGAVEALEFECNRCSSVASNDTKAALQSLRALTEHTGERPLIIIPSKTPRILTEDELRRGIIIAEGGGGGGIERKGSQA